MGSALGSLTGSLASGSLTGSLLGSLGLSSFVQGLGPGPAIGTDSLTGLLPIELLPELPRIW